MEQAAKRTRENRTITVDFQNEATYFQLLDDGKAFVECVVAFLLALGFQLAHKASCRGGGCLTRHAHYLRVRLGVLTIWRVQCTTCKEVFTDSSPAAFFLSSRSTVLGQICNDRAVSRTPLALRLMSMIVCLI